MSDTYKVNVPELHEVLSAYMKIIVLRTSGRKPAEYKYHFGVLEKHLRDNGASKSDLKDLERYLTKFATDVIPYDEKKVMKIGLRIIGSILKFHQKKAKREGKKIEFK